MGTHYGYRPSGNSPTGYRYVKWYISAVKVASNYVQASEFKLTKDGVDLVMTGATVTNPGGNNPTVETPPNLVDDNTSTKWLDFNMPSGPVTVIFDMKSIVSFNGYRWATANDEAPRDPNNWIIYGSTDNVTWKQLHSVTNANVTATRLTYTSIYTF